MLRRAALVCFALVLVACGSGGSTASVTPGASALPSQSPSPSPTPLVKLTAADRAQIAQLEKRPLKTPAPAADGVCAQGPFTPTITPYANGSTESDVYGRGPVYGLGSSPIPAGAYEYFDVTYFTDSSVHSVVLVRIIDLSRRYAGRFVGPLALGQSLGIDTIDGQDFAAYSELALPAEDPPANSPAAAPGWGVFHIRQGIDKRFTCAAIQIDTATKTEVLLGA